MPASILATSYLFSVWADEAIAIGNSGEGALLALISVTSLPVALFAITMVIWTLVFQMPTDNTPKWMRMK